MNIEIKRNSAFDDKSDYLKWDLHANKLYRLIVLSFLSGLVCLAISWYNSSLSVLDAIGSTLIILSVISLFNAFRSRSAFINRYKAKDTTPGSNNELIISLQNTSFKYESFEIKQEFKWSVFRYYKYADGILLLLPGDSYLSAYAIYKDELTEQEFLELLDFVKKIFPEKK